MTATRHHHVNPVAGPTSSDRAAGEPRVPEVLKIVQLSDCHVSGQPGVDYRGSDPRANLERLLPAIRQFAPDTLLLTGDLSEDASPAAYRYLVDRLSGLGAACLALPGNHDDAGRLQNHFAAPDGHVPLVFEHDHWQLLLLDSAVPGEIGGRLPARALQELDQALARNRKPKLVALHHQPLPIGSHWIDRFPLAEPEAFWDTLAKHPRVQLVVWGHVHQAGTFSRGGITALAGPSSASNSLPGRRRFEADPKGPACRWLRLEANGVFETGVLNAEQARQE